MSHSFYKFLKTSEKLAIRQKMKGGQSHGKTKKAERTTNWTSDGD